MRRTMLEFFFMQREEQVKDGGEGAEWNGRGLEVDEKDESV